MKTREFPLIELSVEADLDLKRYLAKAHGLRVLEYEVAEIARPVPTVRYPIAQLQNIDWAEWRQPAARGWRRWFWRAVKWLVWNARRSRLTRGLYVRWNAWVYRQLHGAPIEYVPLEYDEARMEELCTRNRAGYQFRIRIAVLHRAQKLIVCRRW